MVAYKPTSVKMADVVKAMQTITVDKEVKRMAYIIFRNESGNGDHGINNNYCGIQADSGRWSGVDESTIAGVVAKIENGTGKNRLFLAFKDVTGCINFLFAKVKQRGLFIGGDTHVIWHEHIDDLTEDARAYIKEWVRGFVNAEPTAAELQGFCSMYRQAANYFQ
jgi:hypothetical protein